MRAIAVSVCLAAIGCGRIDFQPRVGDAGGDGAMDSHADVSRIPGGWGTADLTALGTVDWIHWGYGANAATVNRKAGVPMRISTFGMHGVAVLDPANTLINPVSWTDGTPTAVATDAYDYVFLDTAEPSGTGFALTVQADRVPRTLTLYVGQFCTRARVVATFADGSSPLASDTSWDIGADEIGRYVIDFISGSDAAVLNVDFSIDFNHCTTGDVGELWLMAATLS